MPGGAFQPGRAVPGDFTFNNRHGSARHLPSAVDAQVYAPPADPELAADGRSGHFAERFGGLDPVAAAAAQRCNREPVLGNGAGGQEPLAAHRGKRVDDRGDIFRLVVIQLQPKHGLGPRHQRQAHSRHDTQVRLDEKLVGRRTKSRTRPAHTARQRRRSRAHDIAIGKDDLEPANAARMVAIGAKALPAIERVSQHRTPAIGRHRQPVRQVIRLQVIVQIVERHTRLDRPPCPKADRTRSAASATGRALLFRRRAAPRRHSPGSCRG